MKSLIRLGILIGIIAVVYYRFYGNEQEKETSKKVINTGTDLVKDLGKLTWSLLKKERKASTKGTTTIPWTTSAV